MGSPQCPPLPGLCSLVATAPHPVMPLQAQGLTYPSTTSIPIFGVRGGSSVGRAPGLQPGGRGFESHPLHSRNSLARRRVAPLHPRSPPVPPLRSPLRRRVGGRALEPTPRARCDRGSARERDR